MSGDKRIPYIWEEIEDQIRKLIIAQASILTTFGPRTTDVTDNFLGTHVEICDPQHLTAEERAHIDITRHRLYHIIRRAYDFAYQTGDLMETLFAEDPYEIACGLLDGYPQADMHGDPTPLSSDNDFPLRRVLETCLARYSLQEYNEGLTVRELSLLSNLGEPTVRSSISKEGFRLETPSADDDKSRAKLSAEDAYLWLSRRRGYIPDKTGSSFELRQTVISAALNDPEIGFSAALERILELTDMSREQVVRTSQVPEDWFEKLSAGNAVLIDLDALKQLASALDVSTPLFVAKAVQHLLKLEADRKAGTE